VQILTEVVEFAMGQAPVDHWHLEQFGHR